jgi:hypothetical protein
MSGLPEEQSDAHAYVSEILSRYREFIADFEVFIDNLHIRYAEHVNCRVGCSKCCVEGVQTTAIEAAEIDAAVRSLDAERRAAIRSNLDSPGSGRCPALLRDSCTIYAQRPVFCRIFGLPLIDDDPPLTLCDLNFNAYLDGAMPNDLPTISLPMVRAKLRVFNDALCNGAPPPTRSVREVLAESLDMLDKEQMRQTGAIGSNNSGAR